MSESSEKPIRVLVVDDSSVMRRIITTALAKHPEIEIVGYGHNGLEAIAKVKELAPEVVTMDIEMPEMNGLAALREIRKTDRLTPIIMFSTLTQAGAQATVTALMDGATDYVGKPTSISGGAEAALKVLDAELVPKIIGLARRRRRPKPERPARPERPERTAVATPPLGSPLPSPAGYQLASPPPGGAAPVAALVIGVSTGGPVALQEIFTTFTAPLSVPVFIVQHMPPAFTSLLAARLTATTVMDFREATNDEIPAPGTVYLAPGGKHLALARKEGAIRMQLSLDEPENSCRPAVDVLFRSAAEVYGSSLLALMLTGMGYDGLKGCVAVRNRNGQVIAQDEESSVIWGMPGAVVENGLAGMVLPLDKIANQLLFRTRRAAPAKSPNG